MKFKNQKGFAPILVLLIAIVVISAGAYVFKEKLITQKTPKSDNTSAESTPSDIYKSPLGFSFKKASTDKINEFSYDINKLGELSDDELIYPPSVDTSSSSVGTSIETDTFYLTATRLNSVGTISGEFASKMAYGGGNFFRFLWKDGVFFDEVKNLIDKKITEENTEYFDNSGQTQRFKVTPYSNPTSDLYGITNYRISGFSVPGLALHKEYYFMDKGNKYIFYVSSELTCEKKQELEKNSEESEVFNSQEYITTLHSLVEECERTSKNKADLDTMLGSLKIN